jgi:hypothetical protein
MSAAWIAGIIVLAIFLYEEFMRKPGSLGYSDLVTLAQNAGFSGADAYIAAAVAMAESSGDPNAYNPETAANTPEGQGSYGLWQIYLKAHPEYSGYNLYDPQTNANAAFEIYSARGGTFAAWSTFNSRAYEQYVQTGDNQSG